MAEADLRGACLCGGVRFEIPAGLLESDPGLLPDKHIFIEGKAAWCEIADDLPRLTKSQLVRLRRGGKF